jgi:hypothetical protein
MIFNKFNNISFILPLIIEYIFRMGYLDENLKNKYNNFTNKNYLYIFFLYVLYFFIFCLI